MIAGVTEPELFSTSPTCTTLSSTYQSSNSSIAAVYTSTTNLGSIYACMNLSDFRSGALETAISLNAAAPFSACVRGSDSPSSAWMKRDSKLRIVNSGNERTKLTSEIILESTIGKKEGDVVIL